MRSTLEEGSGTPDQVRGDGEGRKSVMCHSSFKVALLALLLAGCATSQSTFGPRPALPSRDEVIEFIETNWPDWSERFARISSKRGEPVGLVDIGEVECEYAYVTPQCWAEVTGRFEDGSMERQRMFAQYERDENGDLTEVLVMYHRRR